MDLLDRLQQESQVRMQALQGPIAKSLIKVKHKIAVFSGKGGVGKTTATVNLAVTLAKQGYQVAILDSDVHGPAVPKMIGAVGKLEFSLHDSPTNQAGHDHHDHHGHHSHKEHKHTAHNHQNHGHNHQDHDKCRHNQDHGNHGHHHSRKAHGHSDCGSTHSDHGHGHGDNGNHGHNHHMRFEPVITPSGVKMVSVDSIWPAWQDPVMWRGPYKARMIRQFLGAINWGELDYLFVDLPPGTGDEVLTIMNSIPGLDGMVVVSTPQDVSTNVCQKAINTAKEMNVPILGVVENMATFCCPHCHNDIKIFGQGTAVRLARMMEVDFLGSIPFVLEVNESSDAGVPVVLKYPESSATREIAKIAASLVDKVAQARGRQE